jgi:hypothetical protein
MQITIWNFTVFLEFMLHESLYRLAFCAISDQLKSIAMIVCM